MGDCLEVLRVSISFGWTSLGGAPSVVGVRLLSEGRGGVKLLTTASYSMGNARGKFDPGVSNFGSQRWGFGTVN